ncbi:MAG: hypothetical protein ACFCAD_23670 [Pleurocapsa sp.]
MAANTIKLNKNSGTNKLIGSIFVMLIITIKLTTYFKKISVMLRNAIALK